MRANVPGLAPWDGWGLRGTSSHGPKLDDVRLPAGNLPGAGGDQVGQVFGVVVPYILVAGSGVQSSLSLCRRHEIRAAETPVACKRTARKSKRRTRHGNEFVGTV